MSVFFVVSIFCASSAQVQRCFYYHCNSLSIASLEIIYLKRFTALIMLLYLVPVGNWNKLSDARYLSVSIIALIPGLLTTELNKQNIRIILIKTISRIWKSSWVLCLLSLWCPHENMLLYFLFSLFIPVFRGWPWLEESFYLSIFT